jgi:hypothetical protein
LASIQKNTSNLQNSIAKKSRELTFTEQRLQRLAQREEKKRRVEELEHENAITREVRIRQRVRALQNGLLAEFPNLGAVRDGNKHDIFIGFASQDKKDFVEPLAEQLRKSGLRVWYDDFELKAGDSLSRSIDKGIATSTYGIVVLSPHFFAKAWPRVELDGLTARIAGMRKLVLLVYRNLKYEDVLEYSPSLANKFALDTERMTLEEIAEAIEEVLPAEPDMEDAARRVTDSSTQARRLETLVQSVYASLAIEDPTVTIEEVREVVARESA